jgi:hypothetical protein
MGVLLEYKWWILVSGEVIACLAILYMPVARYWHGSQNQFIFAKVVAGVSGYALIIALAFMDYYHRQTLNAFPFQVALILYIGIVFAHKYVNRIDTTTKRWIFKKRTHLINENIEERVHKNFKEAR